MTLQEMIAIVCDNRPKLLELLKKGKDVTLLEYYRETLVSSRQAPDDHKQIIFEAILSCLSCAGVTTDQEILKKEFFNSFTVSTADHHGPLSHPFFANNAFMESLLSEETKQSTIFHLPCSGISLDNSSYPRGFLVHNQKGDLVRIPLVPLKQHRRPVYGLLVTQSEIYKHATAQFEKIKTEFGIVEQQKIVSLLNTLLDKNSTTLEYYSDLIVRINAKLWQIIFDTKYQLLTLDQESVVREILVRNIGNKSFVDDILFDKEQRSQYIRALDGAVGAATRDSEKGTDLFWYVGTEAREQLTLKKDILETATGAIIRLEKDSIQEALKKRQIYPNMALTFTVLCFMYGLRTGGGFCQINYLPEILRRTEEWSGRNSLLNLKDAALFRGEYTFLPFEIGGRIVEATPLDVLLYAPKDWQVSLKKRAHTLSLEQGLCGMMSEFYKITTGETALPTNNPSPIPLWHVTN